VLVETCIASGCVLSVSSESVAEVGLDARIRCVCVGSISISLVAGVSPVEDGCRGWDDVLCELGARDFAIKEERTNLDHGFI
jgi:hypothetical protein